MRWKKFARKLKLTWPWNCSGLILQFHEDRFLPHPHDGSQAYESVDYVWDYPQLALDIRNIGLMLWYRNFGSSSVQLSDRCASISQYVIPSDFHACRAFHFYSESEMADQSVVQRFPNGVQQVLQCLQCLCKEMTCLKLKSSELWSVANCTRRSFQVHRKVTWKLS